MFSGGLRQDNGRDLQTWSQIANPKLTWNGQRRHFPMCYHDESAQLFAVHFLISTKILENINLEALAETRQEQVRKPWRFFWKSQTHEHRLKLDPYFTWWVENQVFSMSKMLPSQWDTSRLTKLLCKIQKRSKVEWAPPCQVYTELFNRFAHSAGPAQWELQTDVSHFGF